MCPDHKNTPQVAVPLLRDRPKLLFTPGRILSRDEPNPGGKITPRPEGARIVDCGGDGARANDADPWMHSSRLLASFTRCCTTIRFSIEPIIVCSAWS